MRSKPLQLKLAMSAIIIALSACSSIQHPEKLAEAVLTDINTTLPSRQATKLEIQEVDYLDQAATEWWEQFNDPQLNKLVETTIENASGIYIVLARLNAARAEARARRSGLFPQLNFNGSASTTSSDIEDSELRSKSGRDHDAGMSLEMQWQTDLFGSLRNTSRAAREQLVAAEAEFYDTKRVLIGDVVQLYFDIVALEERIRLSGQAEQRREKNQQRINKLLKRGYSTTLSKSQTDTQFYQATSNTAELKLRKINRVNQLATLVGIDLVAVRALLAEIRPLPATPDRLKLPSITQLLKHRPDLRRLERDLVASAYALRAEEAGRYPTLNLTTQLSKDDGALTTPINRGSFPNLNTIGAQIIANLTLPILGRGRILAEIDRASAVLQEVHIQFEQGVRTAIQEIDTAIATVGINHWIYQQRLLSSQSATIAEKSARVLFDAGEVSYTEIINAEERRASEEDRAIQSHQQALQAYVGYLADVIPAW